MTTRDKMCLWWFFFGMKMQSISFSKGHTFPCHFVSFCCFLRLFFFLFWLQKWILVKDPHQLKRVQRIFKLKNTKCCREMKRL